MRCNDSWPTKPQSQFGLENVWGLPKAGAFVQGSVCGRKLCMERTQRQEHLPGLVNAGGGIRDGV